MVRARVLPLAFLVSLAAFVACDDDQEAARLAKLQQSLATVVASCTGVVGNVEIRRARGDHWEKATAATALRAGDWVRTGSRSSARLEFLKGGTLAMDENALVVVDEVQGGRIRVAVAGGVVRGKLTPGGAGTTGLVIRNEDGSEVKMRTDSAGPVEFRLSATDGGTEIAVTRGEVALDGEGGESTLHAGEAADLSKGALTAAVKLIGYPRSLSPGIDARFAFQSGLSIALRWSEVALGTGYRVQVSHDLSFDSVTFSELTDRTEVAFFPSEPGMYAWRVATRDARGRFGEFGFVRRVFLELEKPREALRAPAPGFRVAFTNAPPPVTFAWDASGAEAFQLVIAKSPDLLGDAIIVRRSTTPSVAVADLSAGRYYWGAYVDREPPTPLFLEPRLLVVERATKAAVESKFEGWGK